MLALGVSVQSPDEALAALDCTDVQHIQLPFNLLDWRWREAGVVDRHRARARVTIHVRSVFLQGILAANDPGVWPLCRASMPATLVALIAELAAEFGRESAADLCLAYARGQSWIDGVVVGMETEDQLDTNLRLFVRPPLAPEECARIEARIAAAAGNAAQSRAMAEASMSAPVAFSSRRPHRFRLRRRRPSRPRHGALRWPKPARM